MKIIYFTDWLKNQKIDINKFFKKVNKYKFDDFNNLDEFIRNCKYESRNRYFEEFLQLLFEWSDAPCCKYCKNKFDYWQELNIKWRDYSCSKYNLKFKIKFCRDNEVSQNFEYLNLNVEKKSKIKSIKKIKI